MSNQMTNYNQDLIQVDIQDKRVQETLDAWLKYGTVFLIYRLCTYYFFDHGDESFFDKRSLQLVFYILIGFTLYYLLVKPYIPINLEHPILKNIANDTLMFGTVLVTMHVLETYTDGGDYFSMEWFKSAVIILLAFAAYRVFINPFIPFGKLSPGTASIVGDWAQFGTFLVALRLLQGKSIFDETWILNVLFVLLGFTGYHLVTKNIINVK